MSDFIKRHIGINKSETQTMLAKLGFANLDQFISSVIPNNLLSQSDDKANGLNEIHALLKLKAMMNQNIVLKNFIGMGYYDTTTPGVIRRNVFENPGWYTAYTPYQAEISQGRLEALLNYQQMLIDLTGFEIANASLLDEGTAAAEAMAMAHRINNDNGNKFFIDNKILPHTLSVMQTRAKYFGFELIIDDIKNLNSNEVFGVFIQNPDLYGNQKDFTNDITNWKKFSTSLVVIMDCDLLSLVLFKSPKIQGADIAIGSSQRFGVPIGFGGPSAAYMATRDEFKRTIPGRIIGVSVDAMGKKALRMALQTREQHIRREKATSNICTAQVLLANMAAFYAVYHGAEGLKSIATQITYLANLLAKNLQADGIQLLNTSTIFDTISFKVDNSEALVTKLATHGYALGLYNKTIFISIGESTLVADIKNLFNLITSSNNWQDYSQETLLATQAYRQDSILTHKVFNKYHTETKMMRYLKRLENKDISLVHSMIPLGSCTMKLNAAAELEPLSWNHVADIHPFAPKSSIKGYLGLLEGIKQQLMDITGFDEICLEPNSGAQGEYTGLLIIRRYQESIGQTQRNICLIPKSAHGTNPATAQMIGLDVVGVKCDDNGNVDVNDLRNLAILHRDNLSCLMITYPSTHGVFEAAIKEICAIIHENGGQVYMDGANLNALVGLIKPAELGADVSHINLHKTFAIPHGGGGPGMGPIGLKAHLAKFLPQNPVFNDKTSDLTNVSSAPFGSASILTISWMYNTMLGSEGLKLATKIAILSANYLAKELANIGYQILYTGQNGLVAHECIIDLREIKAASGITEVDFAKRLMDYGFHAPTMSFPVAGTFMIEPTESESLDELDNFILAMKQIYAEVQMVQSGKFDKINNPLKNAPHTLANLITWNKPYSIETGYFPLPRLKESKVFPSVNRIDDAHGDRNFMCSCFDFES